MRSSKSGLILILAALGSAQGNKLTSLEIQKSTASIVKASQVLGLKVDPTKLNPQLYQGDIFCIGSITFTTFRNGELKLVRMRDLDEQRLSKKPTARKLDERQALDKGKSIVLKLWKVSDLSEPKVQYVKSMNMVVNSYIGGFSSKSQRAKYNFVIAAEDGTVISVMKAPIKPK